MYRAWLTLICFASIVIPSRSNAGICGNDPVHISPLTGPAPLVVRATGLVWGAAAVDVNFGNEFTAYTSFCFGCSECKVGTPFDFEHEFVCPGTYEIIVGAVGDLVDRVTVIVTEPMSPVVPEMEVLPFNVFLFATMDVRPATISRSTVDWGDGRSQDFVWKEKDGRFITPTHDYLTGRYTATITHHYEGPYCASDPTFSATFQIPLPTTPVRATTWGSVKTMYRN